LGSIFRADLVLDEFGDTTINGKHIVDGWRGSAGERTEEGEKASLLGGDCEPGAQVVAESVGIVEGEGLKAGIVEEIEGVDWFEVGDEVDLYSEFRRWVREKYIRLLVLVRIEPPFEDSAVWFNAQLVLEDFGAAMVCWAKLDNLRANKDRSLILIVGPVVERDFQSHITLLSALS